MQTLLPLHFAPLGSRDVHADFNAGFITSDAGALLLRELDASTRVVERFAHCFTDYRQADSIEHSVQNLIGQRIYGLALGYEDLNDHDTLRLDPLFATLVGKLDPSGSDRFMARDKGKPLAGKSTLNRLELTPSDASSKNPYKKIVYHSDRIDDLFVELFVEFSPDKPESIILDFDTTDDPIHGNQEGRFFHGYYDCHCYLPLYVFCGHDLLLSRLFTADITPDKMALKELPALVQRIRNHWPDVQIIVRGDSAFSSDPVMTWCEQNQVDYIFGLAQNARLNKELAPLMKSAARLSKRENAPARFFHDFTYRTLKSWSRERRVVGKAEHLPDGPNPRFVVTSLSDELWDPQSLYENLYCARGEMENRLKEQQLGLFADRTSTTKIRSNQLRLLFSSIAYILLNLLRKLALRDTALENAQVGTIRLKLLKIGALVRVTARRVWLQMSSAYPYQALFRTILSHLVLRFKPAT